MSGLPELVDDAGAESQAAWAKRHHEAQCPICMEAWKNGDHIILTNPCSHTFHSSCIDAWVKRQAPTTAPNPANGNLEIPCPLCRVPIATQRHVMLQSRQNKSVE